jgi:hypothetical protein
VQGLRKFLAFQPDTSRAMSQEVGKFINIIATLDGSSLEYSP